MKDEQIVTAEEQAENLREPLRPFLKLFLI